MGKMTLRTLIPFMEELNSVYNGNIAPLQESLIKGSFYSTFADVYNKESLRHKGDRLGQISLAFIRDSKSILQINDLEKFLKKLIVNYFGDVDVLKDDVRTVITMLGYLYHHNNGSLKLKHKELDFYIYNLTVFYRALSRVNAKTPASYIPTPALEFNWFQDN